MNTYVFFWVGKDVRQPSCLVASLVAKDPISKIIMLSDSDTPLITGVTDRYDFIVDRNQLMIERIRAYASLSITSTAVYLDADMELITKFDVDALARVNPVTLCRRSFNRHIVFKKDQDVVSNGNSKKMDMSDYYGKTLDQVFPFLACFVVTRTSHFWSEILEILLHLPKKYHFWYGDQEALRIWSSCRNGSYGFVQEKDVACLPEKSQENTPVAFLHYKGPSRKAQHTE